MREVYNGKMGGCQTQLSEIKQYICYSFIALFVEKNVTNYFLLSEGELV